MKTGHSWSGSVCLKLAVIKFVGRSVQKQKCKHGHLRDLTGVLTRRRASVFPALEVCFALPVISANWPSRICAGAFQWAQSVSTGFINFCTRREMKEEGKAPWVCCCSILYSIRLIQLLLIFHLCLFACATGNFVSDISLIKSGYISRSGWETSRFASWMTITDYLVVWRVISFHTEQNIQASWLLAVICAVRSGAGFRLRGHETLHKISDVLSGVSFLKAVVLFNQRLSRTNALLERIRGWNNLRLMRAEFVVITAENPSWDTHDPPEWYSYLNVSEVMLQAENASR